MIGTELLNIFEKYHIDAGQSKQVEQILKEQNLLETLRTVTPMEKGMTNRSFLATGDQDRKSTRLNSSHNRESRMPSSA